MASLNALAMTSEVRKLSEPLRRITALPDFRQSAAGVGRHIRPRLVDDADHAERHAHAGNLQAVRPRPARHHLADRIGKRRHLAQAVAPSPPPRSPSSLSRSRKAASRPLFCGGLEILAVGFDDLPG